MNVFHLDRDPNRAAQMHCDQHVVKMLTESAQILSTALRVSGYHDDRLYAATHEHHPVVEWASEARDNFAYVHDLATALYDEKRERFGGGHASYDDVIDQIPRRPGRLPEGGSPQPLAMPDDIVERVVGDHSDRDQRDVVTAYRVYYTTAKRVFATYEKGRDAPEWYAQSSAPTDDGIAAEVAADD